MSDAELYAISSDVDTADEDAEWLDIVEDEE